MASVALHRGIGYLKASYHEAFAYKFNMFIGFFSNLVSFLIQYYLWRAVFEASDGSFYGIEQHQYLIYIAAGLLLNQLTTHTADERLSIGIRTGDIVFDLLRPLQLAKQLWYHTLGNHLGRAYALIPVFPVLFLYIDVSSLPIAQLLYFGCSLVLAFILSFQISVLYGLLALWTTNTWGLYLLRSNLFPVLSGQVIALGLLYQVFTQGISTDFGGYSGLLENIAQTFYWLAYSLPLQAIYYTPSGIVSGLINGSEVWSHLLIQLVWIIAIACLIQPAINRLSRKLDIQGA